MIKDGKFAVNPQFEWTGGGLAVTATDLARWARLLYEGKVIDASLMDDLLAGVPARLGPETKYGLGVIIRPTALGVTYGHSGFMPGYQTDVMYFPELKASIAVQVNSSAPRSTGRALRRFVTDFAQIVFRVEVILACSFLRQLGKDELVGFHDPRLDLAIGQRIEPFERDPLGAGEVRSRRDPFVLDQLCEALRPNT